MFSFNASISMFKLESFVSSVDIFSFCFCFFSFRRLFTARECLHLLYSETPEISSIRRARIEFCTFNGTLGLCFNWVLVCPMVTMNSPFHIKWIVENTFVHSSAFAFLFGFSIIWASVNACRIIFIIHLLWAHLSLCWVFTEMRHASRSVTIVSNSHTSFIPSRLLQV